MDLEQFEDDLLVEAVQVVDDPTVYDVSGDILDGVEFTEDQVTATLRRWAEAPSKDEAKKASLFGESQAPTEVPKARS